MQKSLSVFVLQMKQRRTKTRKRRLRNRLLNHASSLSFFWVTVFLYMACCIFYACVPSPSTRVQLEQLLRLLAANLYLQTLLVVVHYALRVLFWTLMKTAIVVIALRCGRRSVSELLKNELQGEEGILFDSLFPHEREVPKHTSPKTAKRTLDSPANSTFREEKACDPTPEHSNNDTVSK